MQQSLTKKKNGKKIDLLEVVRLRDAKLSFREIGKTLGYNHAYVHRVYKEFKAIVKHPDVLESFQHNRSKILNTIELNLLQDLVDENKRKKASLNNVAFAFNKIHDARRLEEGKSTGNVSISIQSAYQDAENNAKHLRKTQDSVDEITDIDVNDVDDT